MNDENPWWHRPVWLLPETKSPYLAPHKTAMETVAEEGLWDVGARRLAVHVETFCQPFDQNSSFSSHFTVSNWANHLTISSLGILDQMYKSPSTCTTINWQTTSLTRSLIFTDSPCPQGKKTSKTLTPFSPVPNQTRWSWRVRRGPSGRGCCDGSMLGWREVILEKKHGDKNNLSEPPENLTTFIEQCQQECGYHVICLSLPFGAAVAPTPLGFAFSCSSTSSNDDSKKDSAKRLQRLFLPGLHAISFGFSLNLYILCHESIIWRTPPVVPKQVCNILEILSGAGPCLFCFRAWGRSCKKSSRSSTRISMKNSHHAIKPHQVLWNPIKFIQIPYLCQSK